MGFVENGVLAHPRAILLIALAVTLLLFFMSPDEASADGPSKLDIFSPGKDYWMPSNNVTFKWRMFPEAPLVDYHLVCTYPNGTLLATSSGTNENNFTVYDLPEVWGYNYTIAVNYTSGGETWPARSEVRTFGVDTVIPRPPTHAILGNGTNPSGVWQSNETYVVFEIFGGEDDLSGIETYEAYFGRDPYGFSPVGGVVDNRTFRGTWSDSVAYLRVRSIDRAWNRGEIVTLYVFMHDATRPLNPESATQLNDKTESDVWQNDVNEPVFRWQEPYDMTSGVEGYRVYWGEDPDGTSDDYVITLPWNAGEVIDGTYYLRVSTRDAAGNDAGWITLYVFRYDGTPPGEMTVEVEVGSRDWIYFGVEAHYNWSVPWDLSGIKTYEWRVDDGEATKTASNGYVAFPPPPDGYHVLYVRAWDLAGNLGEWYQMNFIMDTTPPTGTVLINGGDEYTTDTTVRLAIHATDDLSEVTAMRISNYGIAWTEWIAYNGTFEFNLTPGDGDRYVFIEFRNQWEAYHSELVSDTIILDTTAPAGRVSINGRDEFTSSRDITLGTYVTDANGVVSMRISVDDGPWTPWTNFANLREHTLTPGDGRKLVRVQVNDSAGLVGEFGKFIVLDTTPPTGTIVVNDGQTYANNAQLHLTLSAEDTTSHVEFMRFSEDGVTWGDWEPYSETRSLFQLSPGDGERSVYVKLRDTARMVSTMIIVDAIILDTAGPTGTIEIEEGRDRTRSWEVRLDLTAEDIIGVKYMRFSSDGENWTEWETFSERATFTLPENYGRRVIQVQFRDNAGTVSTDEISDDIILEEDGGPNVWLVAGIIAAVLLGLLALAVTRPPRMKFD